MFRMVFVFLFTRCTESIDEKKTLSGEHWSNIIHEQSKLLLIDEGSNEYCNRMVPPMCEGSFETKMKTLNCNVCISPIQSNSASTCMIPSNQNRDINVKSDPKNDRSDSFRKELFSEQSQHLFNNEYYIAHFSVDLKYLEQLIAFKIPSLLPYQQDLEQYHEFGLRILRNSSFDILPVSKLIYAVIKMFIQMSIREIAGVDSVVLLYHFDKLNHMFDQCIEEYIEKLKLRPDDVEIMLNKIRV